MKLIIVMLIVVAASMVCAQPYDPVVLWDRAGAGDSSAHMGITVLPLGDQDSDGFADWAVYSLGWGLPNQPSEAKIEFFHGGNPLPTTPYRIYTRLSFGGHFFDRADPIGDFNGDGYVDWRIMTYWSENAQWHYVSDFFCGGPNGTATPAFSLETITIYRVAYPLGDFNGDQYDDIYLYDWDHDYGQVLYGDNPMDTIPDWTMHSPPGHRQQAFPNSFGDLNGDGSSDFVSSTLWPENMLYIFYGGTNPDTIPVATWNNHSDNPNRIVRDFNGDQRDDLLTGDIPHINVHFGGDQIQQAPDFQLNFTVYQGPNWDFSSIGDFNHDGFSDVAVVDQEGHFGEGHLVIFLGTPWLSANPTAEIWGRSGSLNLVGIQSAVGLGDANGDGIDDFAIASYNGDTDGQRGRVVILSGDTTFHVGVDPFRPEIPHDLSVSVYPNPFNASTTIQVDLPFYAADASLRIYNLLGQVVHEARLQPMGTTIRYRYDGTSNGASLSSGVYILQATAEPLHATTKLVILR